MGWTWWKAERPHWQRTGVIVGVIVGVVSIAAAVVLAIVFTGSPATSGVTDTQVAATAQLSTGELVTETAPAQASLTAIESSLGVANVTAGDTKYSPGVTGKVDDVLKFQIWYYNREDTDSGKYAADLAVRVALPETQSGSKVVASTVSGKNTAVLESNVAVAVPDHTTLEYIDGSAKWRHNTGGDSNPTWVDTTLDDSIVTTGVVLGDVGPCLQCAATVTILVRVKTI